MLVYFSSPQSQVQAAALDERPVLLSFAHSKIGETHWLRKYLKTFSKILVDSGAFSEMNSGKPIDLAEYREWSEQFVGTADAIACLDDINGDWKKGLANLEAIEWTFPVWHDTDPPELLKDLVEIAAARNGRWIGMGLKPPRDKKESVVRWFCDNVPESLHVHGFALRKYSYIRRFDSFDSCNWWMDGFAICKQFPWLTYPEALELVQKRYLREPRILKDLTKPEVQSQLFSESAA